MVSVRYPSSTDCDTRRTVWKMNNFMYSCSNINYETHFHEIEDAMYQYSPGHTAYQG